MRAIENRPAGNGPAFHNDLTDDLLAASHHSYFVPQSVVIAVDNMRERNLIMECLNRGIRVAVQCKVCGRWLVDPVSVAAGVGPRCATKAVPA